MFRSANCDLRAVTSSAASRSPLVSPAMIMKRFMIVSSSARIPSRWFVLFDLPGDFERNVERALGRFTAHLWLLLLLHAVDEMFQFHFERFLALNRHRLPHDAASGKFAHDGAVFGME